MEEKQQDVWKFLPKIFGRDIKKIELKKSYRNTAEIGRYAGALIGIREPELLERHGSAVEEISFSKMEEAADLVAHYAEHDLKKSDTDGRTGAKYRYAAKKTRSGTLVYRSGQFGVPDRDHSDNILSGKGTGVR